MFNTRKLTPILVMSSSLRDKGWDTPPEAGSLVWVIKNSNGKYLAPYTVEVVATHSSGGQAGCLVLVNSPIDTYYDVISSDFDIIASNAKEAKRLAARMYNENRKRIKKLLA